MSNLSKQKKRGLIVVSLLLLATLLLPAGFPAPTRADSYPPPPVDPRFAPRQILALSRTTYWPIIVASPVASNTLHFIYLDSDQTIVYRISYDNGDTWQPGEYIANETRWGGSIGNISATVDNRGAFTACWFQLYGFAYPGVRCRLRTPDTVNPDGSITPGAWQPEVGVPGSSFERMKVVQVTADAYNNLHLLVGAGSKTLYYSATRADGQWNPMTPMPIVAASYPDPTFLPQILAVNQGKGALLTAWGDARGPDGNGGPTWQMMTAYARPQPDGSASWLTYYFTDTNSSGQYNAGAGQYQPSMTEVAPGRVGLTFSCRATMDTFVYAICYREWSANLAEQGVRMGWLTDTTHVTDPPPDSEWPSIAVDQATQQIYVCWQEDWNNLRITCSHSADGVNWHTPYLVDGESYTRQKMVHQTISHNASGTWQHIVWADGDANGLAIYYTKGKVPEQYPLP